MKTTENITVTDGRMNRALQKRMEPFVQKEATKIVQKELDKSLGRLGKVTKVYPYLDKAEVELKSKKKVLCRLPHHYAGNIIDLFVPQGERDFCKKLKEPCIVPFAPIPCVVLKINDADDSEYFIIDYYSSSKELLYISPPSPGHVRLTCMTATNETYVEFGGKGLQVLSSKPLKISHGVFEDDVTKVDYADASKVYTKEECYNKKEVYTKEEVDELIAKKIEEALNNADEPVGEDNDDIAD